MFQTLFIALWVFMFVQPAYQGIVIDAQSGEPVEFASIEQLDERGIIGRLTADDEGKFALPGQSVHIRVSRLGYTAFEATRSARFDNKRDTIRLFPQITSLQNILVRPGKPTTLATFLDGGRLIGSGLLPGQAVAVLLRSSPSTAAKSLQLTTLRLYLNERPKEGRLRIRLLNVIGSTSEQDIPKPGIVDMLPLPVVYGLSELADLPKKTLTLDLASYGLTVPKEGLYVMVECLLTDPTLVLESAKLEPGHKPQLAIKAHDATTKDAVIFHTSLTGYPKLTSNPEMPTTNIWYRLSTSTSWEQRSVRSYSVRMELDAILN